MRSPIGSCVACAVVLFTFACGSGDSGGSPAGADGGAPQVDGSVTPDGGTPPPPPPPPDCTPPAVTGATILSTDYLGKVDALAVDAAEVFLLTSEISDTSVKYGVFKQPNAGGARTLVADAKVAQARARLFVDAQKVYWSDADGLHAANKAGGSAQVLATSTKEPDNVVFDGATFFWSEIGTSGAAQFLTVPAAGGTPAVFHTLTDSVGRLAVDATHVYYAHVYTAQRVPRGGGTDVAMYTVASVSESVRQIEVHEGSAFLLGDTDIRKIPVAGGAPAAVTTATKPVDARFEGANIFWTEQKPGVTSALREEYVVKVAPHAGGAAKVVLQDEWAINAWATDGQYVYWSSKSTSSLCSSVVRRVAY